jgi:hypothetical protein
MLTNEQIIQNLTFAIDKGIKAGLFNLQEAMAIGESLHLVIEKLINEKDTK